jgi:multidrug efflux pump subunit AcrB
MLFATHTTISVPLTGAIMAMGIATANAILGASRREQLREGIDAWDAALEAGYRDSGLC